jgi:predicted CXXCH cytochrome family protein
LSQTPDIPATQCSPQIFAFALLTILSLGLGCFFVLDSWATTQTESRRSAPLPEGYAGERQCVACHREIYETFKKLGMGQSWLDPSTAPVIEDYDTNNTFQHAKSGFHYRMLRKDGRLIQQRYLLDRNQRVVDLHEEEVTYVVGSGNHARSYLRHHPNGVITQLPVTWYSQQKRWDMSPGYDTRDHLDFSRAIPQGCVFCHTAYPLMDEKQIDDPHYFANPIPEGIGCERCHGPGARHVNLALQGETGQTLKQAIYNPGRDTPEAQRTICYQCHMESSVDSLGTRVLKAGRDVFSFRPGEPFANYATQFSLQAPDSKKLKVVQHADLMEASRCFQASNGQMTCTSCHDPHRKPAAADTASYYRTRCLECHDSRKLSKHTRVQLAGDCSRCHMPRGKPANGGHTVFTNHRVGIYPAPASSAPRRRHSPPEPLVFRGPDGHLPDAEKLFFLGAAYLDAPPEELSARPELARKGTQLLQDYLGKLTSPAPGSQYLSRAEALLGKGYQTLNQPDLAIEHYEKSLRADARQLLPAYSLGLLYAGRGDFSRSAQSFSSALQNFPKHVPSMHGLGALAEARGDSGTALKYFEQAIQLYAPSLASHYRLAQMHLRGQQIAKAVAELQACLSLDPRHLPALVDLGHLMNRQNRLDESRDLFERALKLDDSREDLYNALSVVAGSQGKFDEAVTVLQRAVTKGIAGEITFMNLGNLQARQKNFRQAIQSFDAANKKNPGNPRILFALGMCHLNMGNLPRGKALFEQVLQLDPGNEDARQLLKELARP